MCIKENSDLSSLGTYVGNQFGIAKGTTLSGVGAHYIPYPEGFNAGNSIIISTMTYYKGLWICDADAANRSCCFDGNGIYCYQNAEYDYPSCVYWVILMRIN